MHGLSPVAVSGVEWGATLRRSAQASHCSGFSCCRARVGEQASVVAALGLDQTGVFASSGSLAKLYFLPWLSYPKLVHF